MNAAVSSATTTTESAATADQNATMMTAAPVAPVMNVVVSSRRTIVGDPPEATMAMMTTGALAAATMTMIAEVATAPAGAKGAADGLAIRKGTARPHGADGTSASRPDRARAMTSMKIGAVRAIETMTMAVPAAAGEVGRATPKAIPKRPGEDGKSAARPGRAAVTTMITTGVVHLALATTRATADGLATPVDMRKPRAEGGKSDPPDRGGARTTTMGIVVAHGPETTRGMAGGSAIHADMRKQPGADGKIAIDS